MVLLKGLKWVLYRLLDFALLVALYEIVNMACTPTFKVWGPDLAFSKLRVRGEG
jgi:hypothetical protein